MMKRFNLISLFFTGFLMATSLTAVKAQEVAPPPGAPSPNFNKPNRPDLLKELGLTPDQQQQIKQIMIDRKPQMQEAQKRLHEANRNLDQAIYADNASESEIQTRLQEVQSAQAEVIKFRSMTEFAVRNILTPEQLQKFRDIRRQFSERMKNRFDRQIVRPPNAPQKNNQRSSQPPKVDF